MILLDPRIGSKELYPLFRPYGVRVELTELEFGDACWEGQGENGPVLIGTERKTLHDLISSMRSKRLSGHQLPGLMRTYDHVYLLVEGIFQAGSTGLLEVWYRKGWIPLRSGSSTILYREVDHYLSTLTHLCGVNVIYTSKPTQTVAWIVSRYRWWVDKKWSQHHAHREIYAPTPRPTGGRMFGKKRIGLVEKMASQIAGVDRKAFDVGKKFKSVSEMVNAGVEEWMSVKGIGKVMAERIVEQLKGA